MAYVVPRRLGTWDIRESRLTRRGPRSYTLASFKTLTPEVLRRAQAKAAKPLDASKLRHQARRAGAPVQPATADRAAAELLAEIDAGRPPRGALRQLLLDALDDEPAAASANARAAAAWIGATPKQRGDALRELLVLTDQLPRHVRPERERFPRIDSKAARAQPVAP